MKHAGSIYSRRDKENLQFDHPTKRRDLVTHAASDKSQCTTATLKEGSQLQLKSTSDYNDEEENLLDTIRIEGSIGNDSLFDSLTKYENKRLPANTVLARLLSLQTLFKEMSELMRLETSRALRKELSAVENELLGL